MRFDIKQERLNSGLSQHKLAQAVGISQQTISHLEREITDSVSVITAVKIAKVLGVTVESMVK